MSDSVPTLPTRDARGRFLFVFYGFGLSMGVLLADVVLWYVLVISFEYTPPFDRFSFSGPIVIGGGIVLLLLPPLGVFVISKFHPFQRSRSFLLGYFLGIAFTVILFILMMILAVIVLSGIGGRAMG